MFGFLRRRLLPRWKGPGEGAPDDTPREERWIADFSEPRKTRFALGSEDSHDALLQGGELVLGLKRSACLAWAPAPRYCYGDHLIEARIRLEPQGGYAAAGLMFRMVEEGTYYLLLVSSKGYFRLDLVRNGSPQTLIPWTEAPRGERSPQTPLTVPLTIVALGSRLLLRLHGRWAAELQDPSIAAGRLCFALASYEAGGAPALGGGAEGGAVPYTAWAALEALSVDSRSAEVGAAYEGWAGEGDLPARLRLAETFAAVGQTNAALVQLRKAEEAAGAGAFTGEALLLAGRLALELGLADEAQDYLDRCLVRGRGGPAAGAAALEKAKLLYVQGRIEALEAYGEAAVQEFPENGGLWAFLGHGYTLRARHEAAARAYDRAFALEGGEGVLAKNAANAYELLGRREEALDRLLRAGRVFLGQGNHGDLGLLLPRLLFLGQDNWEARNLAAKWAFGVEDWELAAAEFSRGEELRRALEAVPPPDAAAVFLRGLLLLRGGKQGEALPLLEAAAAAAPDCGLFRYRLAETRVLLGGGSGDPALQGDLAAALTLSPDDGWVHLLAAQVYGGEGPLGGRAKAHLEAASALLGAPPFIRRAQAERAFRAGSLEEALGFLRVRDSEGVLAAYGGELLFRAGRFGEAEGYYREALERAPGEWGYRCGLASCLIEGGRYGEAEALLTALEPPPPAALGLIALAAIKKGEYRRAEAACLAALEGDGASLPALLSLSWLYETGGRWGELGWVLRRLEGAPEGSAAAARREELKRRLKGRKGEE